MMNENKVTRWVITHIGDHELRTLTFPQQGRHTFESEKEAKKALEDFREGLKQEFDEKRYNSLEVRPCECWVGHHDPCGIYFD